MNIISIFALFSCSVVVAAFAPTVPLRTVVVRTNQQQLSPPLSMVGWVAVETEEDARFLLSRAKQVAYSTNDNDYDLEDAETLLREMLHVQSGCVSGTLVGHDLCDEQDVAADVVAHLREKVKHGKDRMHPVSGRSDPSIVPWITTELLFVAMGLIVAIFWTTLDMSMRNEATDLTAQEWWWAMQGGYIENMLEYYFRAG